jgi:hypothetical protein
MTPAEYKAAIKQLGLTQHQAALWLGVSKRTGQNYAIKGPPLSVAMLLRQMIRFGLKPQDVANG